MSSFPIFDPATPKVSILSIGKGVLESAIDLVAEATQQAAKFQPQAEAKAGFMLNAYGASSSTKCILTNATGVRLQFFEAGSKGILPEYKPPSILEPGEVASFLVDKNVEFELKYNIQTFQGPMAGWVSGDANKTVTVTGVAGGQCAIDAVVQVDSTTMYQTQFTFSVSFNDNLWEISVNQSITGSLPPIVGTYECHKYDGTENKNDWHYVTIKAEGSQLRWSNRAGVSWMLTPRADGNLDVGKECPYYKNRHTVCQVVRNSAGSVTSLLGPWGEPYDAA